MRTWILTLALLCCTGCPEGQAAKETVSLNLGSSKVPRPLRVGDSANLDLTLQRGGEVGDLFNAGAFIADDSKQRLTQWHAEPEGAVKFDAESNSVTFESAGDVLVWASWSDAEGNPLTSNRLSFTVAGK